MDIVLRLDPALPRRRAVETALRRGIALGHLPVDSRIPAARDLALELGVARGTVTAAIDDLVADGVLVTRERAGTFVARAPGPADAVMPAPPTRPARWDLRPGRPESGAFPVARWVAATRRAAATGGAEAQADDDGRGSLALRTQLASYLARARGVEAAPESIVVCAGYRSGMTVLAAALRGTGASAVAIEDPGLPSVDAAWGASGMRVTDLPVDGSGARVDLLDASIDIALLTPAHQFPLGVVLSAERRREVLQWAASSRSLVVEDDYDGEFRFDRRPVAALQRSAPDRVAYVGSVSKALDIHLRLGWMALPPDLIEPVAAMTLALTGGVPLLDQLALAELLRRGDYERHVRRQRREYARRRRLLEEAVGRRGSTLSGIPAGMQALVQLPDRKYDEVDGAVDAGGTSIHLLSRYTRSTERPPAAVVGFATPSRSRFEPAVEAFAQWLRGVDQRPGSSSP
ncbi:PLP-dependent aminotransferase family protein [Cnuibacter physcomitrellae]|uniref:MocR-like pyridoxine biosynthesis transcription factor PdxR n=1 Tax=Cnuibacter physcomitrellae TaxID=1619308 RepID=UPI002175B084|nr:PLP-dependent aminotransferase family protein [Cnuibacter physcomitrellae]MCS5498859.1 PLP-dependent aminotransferase family protein [Cnuibacter physcomitrellae]